MAMRITEVEAIPLFVPVPALPIPPFNVRHEREAGKALFAGYRATIVRLTTDEGVVGVGECGARLAPLATKAVVDELRPVLLGKDPTAFDYLWDVMFAVLHSGGHTKGFFVEAISGIDIACWDIVGKTAGRSVASLMGGPHRRSLRAYASSLPLSADRPTLEQRAAQFVDRGYTMAKAKIGKSPEAPGPELDTLRYLCERFHGRLEFVVDANCAYDVPTALTVGRVLEELGVRWFEEPLAPDNHAGLSRLAGMLRVPLAGGESEHTRFHFREILATGAYAVIQPNVARAGGLTECRKIAALAEAYHVPYAPHVGTSSAVCIAATLQLSAAISNFLAYEHMGPGWAPDHPNPLRADLVQEPLEVLDQGFVTVPDRPGLGVALNDDVLDRYRVA
jgi:D-galactarolactone cycloisomerase